MESTLQPRVSELIHTDWVEKYQVLFHRRGDKGVTVIEPEIQRICALCDGYTSIAQIAERVRKPVGEVTQIVEALGNQWVLEWDGQKHTKTERPHLINAWVHITNNCNLACDYCYVCKDSSRMSVHTAHQVVDALFQAVGNHQNELDGVQFICAGGEPLTNIRTVEAIFEHSLEIARRLNLHRTVGIITNGTLAGGRVVGLLQKHRAMVSVSLDGLGKYNEARHYPSGRPAVGRTLANINRFKEEGLDPFVLITITEANLAGLPEITAYLLEKEIGFRYSLYRDLEGGESMAHRIDDMIAILDECYDLIARRLPSTPFRIYHRFSDVCITRPIGRSCGITRNSVRISHDGMVHLCQTDIGRRQAVGNIQGGDVLEAVRKQTVFPSLAEYPSVAAYETCGQCYWRYQCGGGCPILTLLNEGSCNHPSPYCELFKHVIPKLIRLTALQLIQRRKGGES